MTMVHATLSPGARLSLPWRPDYNALVYVLAGQGSVGAEGKPIGTGQLAVLGEGNAITVAASSVQDARSPNLDVIVLGGRPIREPVAWMGPFVMNTREEVMQAVVDYQAGRLGTIPAVHNTPATLVESRQAHRRVVSGSAPIDRVRPLLRTRQVREFTADPPPEAELHGARPRSRVGRGAAGTASRGDSSSSVIAIWRDPRGGCRRRSLLSRAHRDRDRPPARADDFVDVRREASVVRRPRSVAAWTRLADEARTSRMAWVTRGLLHPTGRLRRPDVDPGRRGVLGPGDRRPGPENIFAGQIYDRGR